MLVLWFPVSNMRPQQKLLLLFYVKKYFRIKNWRRQKLMTLLLNQAPRRTWSLDRDKSWFEDLWDNRHNPDHMNRWKYDFLMSGRTFEKRFILLCVSLEKRDTHFQNAIPVKKWVAVALWRLANLSSFRTTSKTSAIGKLTALEITNKFCEGLAVLKLCTFNSAQVLCETRVSILPKNIAMWMFDHSSTSFTCF